MADIIRSELVREGQDPDWRLGWEEYLSSEARQEVEDTLKASLRVEDADLRIYAQGLARRQLRSFRWSLGFVPIHVALVGLWIYTTCVLADPPQAWCWFYIAIGLIWLFIAPFLVVRRRSHLEAAIRANSDPAPPRQQGIETSS